MAQFQLLGDFGDIFHFGEDVATASGAHLVSMDLTGVIRDVLSTSTGVESIDLSAHTGTTTIPPVDAHAPTVVDPDPYGHGTVAESAAATKNAREAVHVWQPPAEPVDPHAPAVVDPDPYGHGTATETTDTPTESASEPVHVWEPPAAPVDPHAPPVVDPDPYGHGTGTVDQSQTAHGDRQIPKSGSHYVVEDNGSVDPHGAPVTLPGPHDALLSALSDHSII